MATRVRTEPTETLLNRELSHLEFHARVLELATDETLPLLERVNYCWIFSSNLDSSSRCELQSSSVRRRRHHGPSRTG